MWLVRLALRRPYTFVVLSLLLLLAGVQVVRKTPTDIFPSIDLAAISVVWTYGGLPAQQMEQQITQFSEYSIAGNVENIRQIESQSFDAVSVIRIYMQPGADVTSAMAQVTAVSQTILRRMPIGTQPPIIIRYSATSVPILQLAFSSPTIGEAEIFDFVNQRVRTQLSVVQGTRFPLPTGGKFRQISVDLDLEALKAHGLSPHDVNLAVSAQNLTLPTGSAKVGDREYRVSLNSSPAAIAALNDIPVGRQGGRVVLLREVAHVHDGFAVQTQIARRDGGRSVVLSVLKTGEASTVEVARAIRELIPVVRAQSPPGMKVELLADQSTFVTRAVDGLIVEGLIAAGLTAAAILLFLGSLRSTLVVAISIPLSVTVALLAMRALGQTLNIMTLGGLALAVGVLVDDATVEIENIHRNLAMGKRLTRAILDGAREIAVPAFVASTAISIVFVSVIFLEGPARYLFMPMGMAVGFSVMASYLLSRTLIPTLVKFLLKDEVHGEHGAQGAPGPTGLLGRLHVRFNAGFERLQGRYLESLGEALRHRRTVLTFFALAVIGAGALATVVGRDFFPQVDSGQIRLHVTAPPGTRIEETERHFARVEAAIREVIPAGDREVILDQIGIPAGYSLAITDSATTSSADGEVLIALTQKRQRSTQHHVRTLRAELPRRFPELSFYFQPADIVTQILNFGLPSPIDIQLAGHQRDATYKLARKLESELSRTRGVVDVRLHQVQNAPRLHLEVDRVRAAESGLTQRDVANNLLLAVSSSGQVSPSYWIHPVTGLSYPVSVQVPEHQVSSLDAIATLSLPSVPPPAPSAAADPTAGPVTAADVEPERPVLLADLVDMSRQTTPVFVSHTNVQPTFNVRADIQDTDLGSAAARIESLAARYRQQLPAGATLTVRGQIESMRGAFNGLGLGLLVAALLVYALMVINFQSWVDPLIIIAALPGAAVGLVVSLLCTQTTFSVPSLMGALMSIGVGTANSILVVSFANEQRARGLDAVAAAMEAGRVRLRPVLMTALAMGLGMLPMSLGLGEGGEQNAALGRAALGGLLGATVATLFCVPVIYSLLRKTPPFASTDPDLIEPTSRSDPDAPDPGELHVATSH